MEELGGETCKLCLKIIKGNIDMLAALNEDIFAKLEFLKIVLVSTIISHFSIQQNY